MGLEGKKLVTVYVRQKKITWEKIANDVCFDQKDEIGLREYNHY